MEGSAEVQISAGKSIGTVKLLPDKEPSLPIVDIIVNSPTLIRAVKRLVDNRRQN